MIQRLFSFFGKKPDKTANLSDTPEVHHDFTDPEPVFELFTSVTGMHFQKKEAITTEKLKNFCLRKEIHSFGELYQKLGRDPELMQQLIDFLTVNETYFYRELEQVDILKTSIETNSKKNVRILCAPCASGEEVYSIIIRLLESGIKEDAFEVVGIDINAEAIAHCQRAHYSKRSVNRLDENLKRLYFRPVEAHYELKERVKKMAHFSRSNIFDPEFKTLGSFDYIFSRNLFIYFDDETKERAIRIFCEMLEDDGKLFFGHADIFKEPACLTSSIIGKSRVYQKA